MRSHQRNKHGRLILDCPALIILNASVAGYKDWNLPFGVPLASVSVPWVCALKRIPIAKGVTTRKKRWKRKSDDSGSVAVFSQWCKRQCSPLLYHGPWIRQTGHTGDPGSIVGLCRLYASTHVYGKPAWPARSLWNQSIPSKPSVLLSPTGAAAEWRRLHGFTSGAPISRHQ